MPTNERTPGQIWIDGIDLIIHDVELNADRSIGTIYSVDARKYIAAAWNAADALGWKTPEDCARGVEVWREMVDIINRSTMYVDDEWEDDARALLAKLGDSK